MRSLLKRSRPGDDTRIRAPSRHDIRIERSPAVRPSASITVRCRAGLYHRASGREASRPAISSVAPAGWSPLAAAATEETQSAEDIVRAARSATNWSRGSDGLERRPELHHCPSR